MVCIFLRVFLCLLLFSLFVCLVFVLFVLFLHVFVGVLGFLIENMSYTLINALTCASVTVYQNPGTPLS